MSLYALTRAADIAAAFANFGQHFEMGSETLDRQIGYMGGSESATIRWFPELMIWVMFEPKRLGNRYWCAFGVDNPHESELLSITCEINPPHAGIDRQCAGAFVRSNNGTTYMAHSGGIGAGRPGIGKAAFLKYYGDESLDVVAWPDKSEFNYIIIGALDDDEMPLRVAE